MMGQLSSTIRRLRKRLRSFTRRAIKRAGGQRETITQISINLELQTPRYNHSLNMINSFSFSKKYSNGRRLVWLEGISQKGSTIFSCVTWTAETGVSYADCCLNNSQEKSCECEMNKDERQTWSYRSKNFDVSKGSEIISCGVNIGEKINRMRLFHEARNWSECMSRNCLDLNGNVNSSKSHVVLWMRKKTKD